MNIYEYFDYRKYLKDYYEFRKKDHPFFSYRYIARRVNLDPGYLVKVLQGKYNIAQRTIEKFIILCKLDGKEAEYFETMVHFAKAKSEKQIKLYFEKLLAFKKVKFKRIEPYQYEFYQKWYYSAMRSLLDFYKFTGDYRALASQLSPPITVKEAKNAVKLLEKLAIIKKNKDGGYSLTNTIITTGDAWRSIAIRQFQKDTIQLAKESLERHQKDIRDISTVTMAIALDDLEDVRDLAQEFRASVLKLAEESQKPNSVYQLNIQLIPLTEIKKKES